MLWGLRTSNSTSRSETAGAEKMFFRQCTENVNTYRKNRACSSLYDRDPMTKEAKERRKQIAHHIT